MEQLGERVTSPRTIEGLTRDHGGVGAPTKGRGGDEVSKTPGLPPVFVVFFWLEKDMQYTEKAPALLKQGAKPTSNFLQ